VSTPIRQQYLELKQRYPGVILFFRLGDFYETFDDDAKLVSEELKITLTSKPMGKDFRVPLAGVPYHSIDGHVAKLVKRGYRVAICEQMADPADVKGLVPREVVRVVTAGTVTSEHQLDSVAPNYLAAFATRRDVFALALADITTGEVRLASGEDARMELLRATPAELLAELDEVLPPGVSCPVTRRPFLSDANVRVELARQYGEQAIETLVSGAAQSAALAHLLAYLRETYPAALGALQRVRPMTASQSMAIDPRTLRNLDVFPIEGRMSLLKVLDNTQSPMGARLLRNWLTHPLRQLDELTARHDAVSWSVARPLESEQCQAVLRAIGDIGRLVGKLGSRAASPRDLHAVRHGLRSTLDLGAIIQRSQPSALLGSSCARLSGAAEPLLALDAALDPDPPTSFDEGGIIRPGFIAEIDTLRAMTREARGFILALEATERERSGIKSMKIGHNRIYGFYFEVSQANSAHVPSDFQRRQTLVGAERYVTPELKDLETQLDSARDRLVELERDAFEKLVATLIAHLPALQAVAEAVATIDLCLGLGLTAARRAYVRPAFNTGECVDIRGGRHPVVEAALGPGQFVPNDCLLNADCQITLLTGPNMSGKSTFLRQVALIALMAQIGSFVPAASAELPLFDRIFTRIGASDDLAAGQSTFMVEMVETAQILHQATPQSLVILDEVGRGTSTYDGMAIARSVVEFLHNRAEVAARTLFATHYHELTGLSEVLPRLRNAHIAVHDEGGEVVFEHRILSGPSDRSYGIHVARLAGLPSAVITRAEHLLSEFEAGRRDSGFPSAERNNGHAVLQQPLFAGPSSMELTVAGLDIDGMTPIEAIQKLYELRAAARTASK
jgi:DNA mismatch repair protein MutS